MSTESLFFVGTYTTRGSLGIYTVTLDVDSTIEDSIMHIFSIFFLYQFIKYFIN